MIQMYHTRDLTPHPVLERLVPPLTEEEFDSLKADIDEQGVLVALVVAKGEDGFVIVDGLHRYKAARELEIESVPCVLLDGLSAEKEVETGYRLNGNRRHLTIPAKRRWVQDTLREYPHWSDRQVGRLTGMSYTTIGKCRKELEEMGDVPILDTRTDTLGREVPAHKGATTRRGAPKRQAEHRLDSLIRAARDVVTVTDEEIMALDTNPLMLKALADAKDLLDRILTFHQPGGKYHGHHAE